MSKSAAPISQGTPRRLKDAKIIPFTGTPRRLVEAQPMDLDDPTGEFVVGIDGLQDASSTVFFSGENQESASGEKAKRVSTFIPFSGKGRRLIDTSDMQIDIPWPTEYWARRETQKRAASASTRKKRLLC
ncbi:hypothetical protein Cni_G17221 [Canna indica]|uniref:Uncharacterized protein n=1 Tax=Canna indica TaxID=4628 RepID=A0AAQ3KK98_9LILI|nr:hypothetical protein Cni_G17221 [Canna indica]